ncbi:potassium transporter Trk [Ruminococcaceae bacterium OttesenSCG-928-A16]|nr:potassium transporter Trk [Ruminococcaceae bacterium OttesenSCG-928-A16]
MSFLKRLKPGEKLRGRRSFSPARIIVVSFFLVICTGALLLKLPFATHTGYIAWEDAFFTATSATCVTGLVVKDTYQYFTLFGQLVIITLIQIGGLGLVTIVAFINFAIGKRLGLRNMQLASETTGTGEVFSAKRQIVTIVKTALLFEVSGIVLLGFYFVPRFGAEGIYISIFLGISMFCNAGFDILSRGSTPFMSLTEYANQPYPLIIIALLIICGGLGFVVWHDIAQWRRTKRLMLHTKIVLITTGLLLVGGTVGVYLMEFTNPVTLGSQPVGVQWLSAFFQAVSARTAGANSIDCAAMNDITKLFMSMLMFMGASPGSTGGGIKTTTVAVIVLTVISVVRGKEDTVIFGRRIDKQTVYKSLTIFVLSFVVLLAAAMAIYYNTGPAIDEIDSLFEASSAFGTVGLTIGATTSMNLIAKLATMLTMYIGRCGPVALAASLTLRGSKNHKHEILPEGRIMVG